MMSPILITGCARSGTSLIAGLIAKSGAQGGVVQGAGPQNMKGQFENKEVRDHITKPYLRSIGMDPLGQKPLPDVNNLPPCPDLKARVIDVMTRHKVDLDKPWYYKGAKLCLVYPLWCAEWPDAQWVVVRRPDRDIIKSCLRTGFMRAYRDVQGWQGWVDHHKICFAKLQSDAKNVHTIWSNEVINGRLDLVERLINDLGLHYSEDVVKDFVDPKLFHFKSRTE